MAPNTGAGGSHPGHDGSGGGGKKEEGEEAEEQQCGGGKRSQAGEWTLRPAREWQKWADCVDVESEGERGQEVEQEARMNLKKRSLKSRGKVQRKQEVEAVRST